MGFGTSSLTMMVVYISVIAVAITESISAVSRLLKHIPVYGFYGYWRMKEKENNAAKHENLVLEEFGEFGLQTAFFRDAF